MLDVTFNQSMLAQLIKVSPNTVSRFTSIQQIEPLVAETGPTRRYSLESVRKITDSLYASHKRPILEKVQAFYNFKGGTGKTSLCFQVASHLSILGFNVLALDLDPQGHLTSVLRIPEDWPGPTIYDVMINEHPLQEAIVEVMPGLHLLPANISMTRIEVPLSAKNKREERLRALLQPIKDSYDFIIMDTNPTISTLNMNALVASDRVNIVCETQPFSLAGLHVLVDEMLRFYSDMGLEPNYCIIPNKYEIKTATSQEVLGAVRSEYGDKVLNAVVRKSEEINISAKKKLPVSVFSKSRSPAFEDVMDLVHLIVHQSQQNILKQVIQESGK
jgi:chromosome partitioning protein